MKQFMMDGYVCGKLNTRTTQSGKSVTTFSLNSPERHKNRDTDEWESVPQFFSCQYWHKFDRDYRASEITDKAHLVITGEPTFQEWESDGKKYSKVVFNVRDLWVIKPRGEQPIQDTEQDFDSVYDADIPF